MVQKRHFRKSHPDSHYCAVIFRYMRDYAARFSHIFLFACIDDKHSIKVGEPGFPVSAAERGRQVILLSNDTFVVGDHGSASDYCSVFLYCQVSFVPSTHYSVVLFVVEYYGCVDCIYMYIPHCFCY